MFVIIILFLQYEDTQNNRKEILKYNKIILALRNLQKTGMSFHQLPLPSEN